MLMEQKLDDTMEFPANNNRLKGVYIFGLAILGLAGIAVCGFRAKASTPDQFLNREGFDEQRMQKALFGCVTDLPKEFAKETYTPGEKSIIKVLLGSCLYLQANQNVIGDASEGEGVGEDTPQEIEAVSNVMYAHKYLGEHIIPVRKPVRKVSQALGWLYGQKYKSDVRKEAKGVRKMLVELININNKKHPSENTPRLDLEEAAPNRKTCNGDWDSGWEKGLRACVPFKEMLGKLPLDQWGDRVAIFSVDEGLRNEVLLGFPKYGEMCLEPVTWEGICPGAYPETMLINKCTVAFHGCDEYKEMKKQFQWHFSNLFDAGSRFSTICISLLPKLCPAVQLGE